MCCTDNFAPNIRQLMNCSW